MDSIPLVIVDYAEISTSSTSEKLLSKLEEAFGSDGYGIIAIRDVPDFVQAKKDFLPLAHKLQGLPQDYLEEKVTDKKSLYNAGWSHGKEKLGGEPDFNKASFYFNPLTDQPGTQEERDAYPLSYISNVWPTEKLPELEEKGKRLGVILKQATVELARHIDALAKSKRQSYPDGFLYNNMKETEKAKARLLYYFPLDNDTQASAEDAWIGWHNDSGFLTALAGDMYINHQTGEQIECPDPEAGLYAIDRHDNIRRVHVPNDCMAVQIGECLQIVAGGTVAATPHAVRGCKASPNIARISFPCFIDTPPMFELHCPADCAREQVLSVGSQTSRVPPLDPRWENGMTFGAFLDKTFKMYYDWKK